MVDKVSAKTRLIISLSGAVWFLLFCSFSLGSIVLAAWAQWLFWSIAVVAVVIALLISWIRGFGGKPVNSKNSHFVKTVTLTLFVLVSIVTLPFYFLAFYSEARPLIMPQVVLTNQKKTIIFQGMVHVGSESFYKSVIYDLETALDEGYKLYYEGIAPSTPEADSWFSNAIAGGRSLSSNYRDIAGVCGVEFQLDYFQLMVHDMQRRPGQHMTVDVTTETLQKEYIRLQEEDPEFAKNIVKEKTGKDKDSDGSAEKLINFVHGASDGQKTILGMLCRGFFSVRLQPSSGAEPQALDPLLLEFRNRHLVEAIAAEAGDKIYITYGAGHLPGVIKLLKQADPAWEIKSIKWLRAISSPEHFERELTPH